MKSGFWIGFSYWVVSALFCWPAPWMDPQVLPTRHFDLYPVLWLIQEAPSILPLLFHPTSAWPYGESLVRIDSYLLLGIGWLNHGWLSPLQVVDLLMWGGPALNAMAAEVCAHRAFGVPRPYSWIAGLSYGFSGIAAVALLEGHVYHLLNPWMPLLLGALWVGTGPQGRWYHGFLGGLAWALCQFTSAYLGIGAFLVAVGLWLRAPRLHLLPGLALGALPPAAYYLWLFSMGGTWKDNAPPAGALQTGVATLGTLLGASPLIDLGGHSIAAPLAFLSFWLWALAPWVLKKPWKGLWLMGLLSLLFSFGAYFRAVPGGEGMASPLAWLALWFPSLSFFRFPIRFLWVFSLISGVMASRVMAERWRGGFWWGGLALVDVFWTTGMPGRLSWGIAEVPSAYASAPPERAVLDLFGEALDPSSGELEMRSRVLGCYYQSFHHRPITEVCIGTSVQSPREELSRWLMQHTDDQDLLKKLGEAGIGAVVLHLDTLRPADARVLAQALQAAGPPVETSDGGEHLQLFALPRVETESFKAGMQRIRAQ